MLVLNGGHAKPRNAYHGHTKSQGMDEAGVLTELMTDVTDAVKEVMGIEDDPASPDSHLGLGIPADSFENLPQAALEENERMASDHKGKCKAFLQWHEDMVTWGGERRLMRKDSTGFESEYHMRHGIQHLVRGGLLEDAARVLGTSLDFVRMRADRKLLSLYMSDSMSIVLAAASAPNPVDVTGVIAMRRFVNHRRDQLLKNPDVVFQMAAQEPEHSAAHHALLRIPFERLPYNLVWWTNRTRVPTACEATIRQRGRINAVTWCPISRTAGQPSRLAWGVGREVRVFDVMKEQMVLRLPDNDDGEEEGEGCGGATVAELLAPDNTPKGPRGHRSVVLCLAFSPDGKLLASGGADQRAIVWCTETGLELKVFNLFSAAVVSVAFSTNGQYLTTSTRDSSVRVWEVSTGQSRQLQQALEDEWDDEEWETMQAAELAAQQESAAMRLARRVSKSDLVRSLSPARRAEEEAEEPIPAPAVPDNPAPPPDPADAYRPKGPGGPCTIAGDGSLAAVAERGTVEALQGGPHYRPTFVGLSSMATAIRLWEDPAMLSGPGEPGETGPPPTTIVAPAGTEGSVRMVKFQPGDNSKVSVLGVNGPKAWIWRVDSRPEVAEDGTSECSEVTVLNAGPGIGRVTAVTISMDHTRVLGGTANGMVVVWDVPFDNPPPATPGGHDRPGTTGSHRPGTTGSHKAWGDAGPGAPPASPNKSSVGWAGADLSIGEEIHDTDDEGEGDGGGEEVEELYPVCVFQAYYDAPINSLRLSPCGRYLATGGDNSSLQDSSLQIWNVEDAIASMSAFRKEVSSSREVFRSGHSLSDAEFRERVGASRMVFKGGKVDEDDAPEVDFSYACGPVEGGRSYVVAANPDDADELLLWQVEGDGEQVIRDYDANQTLKLLGLEMRRPTMPTCCPTPHADDLGEPAKQPLQGHDDTVTDALFLAHDILATCSSDGTVAVWHVKPGGGGGEETDPTARVVARAHVGQQLVRIAPRNLVPSRPAVPPAAPPAAPNAVQLMAAEDGGGGGGGGGGLPASPKGETAERYSLLVEGQGRAVIALELSVSQKDPRCQVI